MKNDSYMKNIILTMGKPVLPAYDFLRDRYAKKHLKWKISKTYQYMLDRKIDWDNPQDLNEKINWLKLHADPFEWAMLADKYRVREYVKSRGLKDILVPLYGHWDTADDMINDFDQLPEEQ